MTSWRVLVSEPLDPTRLGYRWLTPTLRQLGHDALPLPVLAAVELLGHSGFHSMLYTLVEQWRPEMLLVCPPLDFMSPALCRDLRTLGTRIVAVTRPTEFTPVWGEAEFTDLRTRFDRWLVVDPDPAAISAGAQSARWLAARSIVDSVDDAQAPELQVAVVAPATMERAALAQRINNELGLRVGCFGPGWQAGNLTRPSRIGLLRRANIVLTFTEKMSLSETTFFDAALLGKVQLVEHCTDLSRYVPVTCGPTTFDRSDVCLELLSDLESLSEWSDLPPCEQIWSEWIADLSPGCEGAHDRAPHALVWLYTSIANLYASRQLILQALACAEAWALVAPNDPWLRVFRTRCLTTLKQWGQVLEASTGLVAELAVHVAETARARPIIVQPSWMANALGQSRAIDPIVDVVLMRLQALVQLGRGEDAKAEIRGMSDKLKRTVAALWVPDLGNSISAEVHRALAHDFNVSRTPD
ncbi:MAG: hypothetical protein AAF704_15850 [Cyanobacteria bacterium P01_D01_bin.123]